MLHEETYLTINKQEIEDYEEAFELMHVIDGTFSKSDRISSL
jgi:hypothetical protein